MSRELASAIESKDEVEPRNVVLYGFGRIGRLLARLLIEKTGRSNKLRLRAIVLRGGRKGDLEKRASLLRRDSVHGPFNGSVEVDEENNAIIANGTYIQVIYANSPDEVDYTKYGITDAWWSTTQASGKMKTVWVCTSRARCVQGSADCPCQGQHQEHSLWC